MTSTVDLEVGDQLLLLGEHRLQSVQLRFQLLNGDLRLALGSGRVLVVILDISSFMRDAINVGWLTLVVTQELSSPTLPSNLFQHSTRVVILNIENRA